MKTVLSFIKAASVSIFAYSDSLCVAFGDFTYCHRSSETNVLQCDWSLARPRRGRLMASFKLSPHNSIAPFAYACSIPDGRVWQHLKDKKDRK